MRLRRAAAGALLVAAACGGTTDEARVRALESRVAALESELQAQQRLAQAMREALRQEGLVLHAAEPVGEEEVVAQGIERLLAATDRLESALASNDALRVERASKAQRDAVGLLARAASAPDRLLAAARAAARPAQQARLVEAAAELAGPTLAPRLESLAADASVPVAVRQQAAKSLLAAGEPGRGLALVQRLLASEPDFPDLYYLVHLAGETRDPAAVPLLCRALAQGANPSIRCHAANALAHFAGAEATAALTAALRDDAHDAVRVNAMRALPHATRDAALVTTVVEGVLRASPSRELKAAAEEALGRARSGALPGPAPAVPGRR